MVAASSRECSAAGVPRKISVHLGKSSVLPSLMFSSRDLKMHGSLSTSRIKRMIQRLLLRMWVVSLTLLPFIYQRLLMKYTHAEYIVLIGVFGIPRFWSLLFPVIHLPEHSSVWNCWPSFLLKVSYRCFCRRSSAKSRVSWTSSHRKISRILFPSSQSWKSHQSVGCWVLLTLSSRRWVHDDLLCCCSSVILRNSLSGRQLASRLSASHTLTSARSSKGYVCFPPAVDCRSI